LERLASTSTSRRLGAHRRRLRLAGLTRRRPGGAGRGPWRPAGPVLGPLGGPPPRPRPPALNLAARKGSPRHSPLRTTPPDDYEQAKASKIGAVPDALFLVATERPSRPTRRSQRRPAALNDLDDYWFANELGRALTRAVESGVRGNTLRRDLDRLLNLFDRSILAMAPRIHQTKGTVLVPETRTMVKQLVEVGLGARQSDEPQRDWYAAPARRLARLVGHLCLVVRERAALGECTPEWDSPCSLPQWTLAGWLMVTDAYLAQQPTSPSTGNDDTQVKAIMGEASQWFGLLEHADWERATELANSALLEPSWDVIVDDDARVERIKCLAARAEKMTSNDPWWRRAVARLAECGAAPK
jgi:hypothetical protein